MSSLNRDSPSVASVCGLEENPISHVPGEPTLGLRQDAVQEFLETELATPILDEVYRHMWLFARHTGHRIDPIHCQRLKGRQIVPIEDSKLHLIWTADTIYLKPIPECLMNYNFWLMFLAERNTNSSVENQTWNNGASFTPSAFHRSQAIGFLRSYAFLVRHRLDFEIAQKSHLIPTEIEWNTWAVFMSYFRAFEDKQVSNRYRFGQIRLSRLHWAVRLFRPRSAQSWIFYEIPYASTWGYLSSMLGPFAFVFASLSVVLSALQLMTASDYSSLNTSQFETAKQISWTVSLVILVAASSMWALTFLFYPLYDLLRQLSYSLLVNKKMK